MQLSVLLLSAADSGCTQWVSRLLDGGASLQARDRLGSTALTRAARGGHVGLIDLFLARGAAIDLPNLAGATALYAAAENERQASVALLLARGADPDLANASGVTALSAAAFKGMAALSMRLICPWRLPRRRRPYRQGADRLCRRSRLCLSRASPYRSGVSPKRTYGNGLTARRRLRLLGRLCKR